jgi:hypothetical protein
MRAIFRIANSLLVVALLLAAQSPGDAEEPMHKSLAQLAKQLAHLPADADPSTLALPAYAAFSRVPDGRFIITFATPIDARELARAFHFERPYAIGVDVHKHHWKLEVFIKDVPDPVNPRIDTADPQLGAWTVAVDLVGRPAGPFPTLFCGASFAYDLERYTAAVTRLVVTKRQ